MRQSVALTLRLLTALCLSAGGSTPSKAATPAGDDLFERSVRPLLAEHCFPCHSHAADKIKGGLVLDSRAGLLSGGDSGPAIVPGQPGESRLIKAVGYGDPDLQMPPKNRRLTVEQIATLTEWVQLGAPWPGDAATDTPPRKSRPRGQITAADRQWWALQPVREPALPPDTGVGWAQNPIDRFIQDRLQREGLTPAPAAEPQAFIRRVTFDLTGLPPTPEEVAAFERACQVGNREAAIENLTDRLLASPRYGERWARHWLDLVRYAESDGYRVDDYRPHVWRYRDWVVRAFNDDLPYDRFVQAQLAGDELWPDDPQLARVATAFLRHWIYEYNNRDARGQQQTILNDLTDVTGDVFLGMGVQCAPATTTSSIPSSSRTTSACRHSSRRCCPGRTWSSPPNGSSANTTAGSPFGARPPATPSRRSRPLKHPSANAPPRRPSRSSPRTSSSCCASRRPSGARWIPRSTNSPTARSAMSGPACRRISRATKSSGLKP